MATIVTALTGLMLLWRSPVFQERFNDAAGPAFDSTEGWIVWVLRWRSRMRPADLAQELGINAPGITKAIARLEAAGMVTKAPHPDDARSVVVELTPSGSGAADQMGAAAASLIRDALDSSGPLDPTSFPAALQQLSTGMQTAARRLLER